MPVLVLGATPGWAENHLDATYGAHLSSCYMAAGDSNGEDCIGLMSSACSAGEQGGQTTLGIVDCNLAEARAWDALLNKEYQASRAFARSSDKATSESTPEFANLEASLIAAQRAWIEFRGAECGLAYAFWGAGSMRNIEASHCQMAMTAERTFELRQLRNAP